MMVSRKQSSASPSPLLAALVCTLVVVASPSAGASQIGAGRDFGLGVTLGAPSGVSMKIFLAGQHALDIAVGVGFFGGASFDAHVDYHFYTKPLLRHSHFDLPLYVGVGGRFNFWFEDGDRHYWGGKSKSGRVGVGVRVPVGVAFHFNKVPVDFFLEIVPGLGVVPGVGVHLDGAIGARYFF